MHKALNLCVLTFVLLFMSLLWGTSSSYAARCLFVSSYHQGFPWSDGIEQGVRSVLEDKCQLRQYDLDARRRDSDGYRKIAALEAKALIDEWQPDVVIIADDDAAKFLLEPYYRDTEIPFVFCGINWSAKGYGLPYSNATGMVEVAPVAELYDRARQIVGLADRVLFIGADTLSEQRNAQRHMQIGKSLGIEVEVRLAQDVFAWLRAFEEGQQYDFIVLGSQVGIPDWQETIVIDQIRKLGGRLTVTNHEWMMRFAMLGMTKIPKEQGEWAGAVALEIIGGASPQDFPVVANRKWDIWTNSKLLAGSSIVLPDVLDRQAKSFVDAYEQ